ncbi:hypothetical protein [Tabrizicola sp. M-4]|uniref:hypothetical protein n=1 Tax=Tabrizicola sp. M-4 TaxID=3055847 RepID=UPI003DA8B62B
MTYCARYRFKLLSPLQIDKGRPLELAFPGFATVTFEMGEEAYPVGHWVTAKIDGFTTEDEARKAGQQLGDTLLVVGAVTKLGIDIGFSRSTLQFHPDIHKAVREKTGRELRSETHGLMVYEKDTVGIIGMQAHGSVLISPNAFQERLNDWLRPSPLTERQRNCAALLNDSFFVAQTEGQFILRISAVEALCDQAVRHPDYQAAIEGLEQHLATQPMDSEIRETLQRTLANAKRQSLRSAYMTKFRTLRSDADAKAFDDLYQKRSKLVHDGIGRGELSDATNAALHLAVSLLEAELSSGASE